MADLTIKKGMDLRLLGAPAGTIADVNRPETIEAYPVEYPGVKPRLAVAEGDRVRRGSPLFDDKRNEAFVVRAPAAGRVETIVYGPRRVIERIVIATTDDQAESFPRHDLAAVRKLSREDALNHLLATGYLALVRQRPFSRMADAGARPKSIFVNAMSTGPFETDAGAAIQGHEEAFQVGLSLLSRLTEGRVHLVLPGGRDGLSAALTQARDAEIHRVSGPLPAGNPGVHIHHLDPIRPGEVVWTVRAADLVQIGRLFVDGQLPRDRVVSLAGPGVREAGRQHYRVPLGAPLAALLDGTLVDGETRLINGSVLSGGLLHPDRHLPFHCNGLTVIREDRDRRLLGWLAPGRDRFSASPLFASTWLNRRGQWDLGSNRNGSRRAMVLTGLYDKYLPMNIMVDYLVRAVLAGDTEEAVQLGLLELDPEDVALCAFACPSKVDLVGIIRKGLALVEEEGV